MITRRALEVATAALTGAFGAAILASSLAIGVGWSSRGVGSGAFPAIAGALIVAGSLYNLVRALPRPGAVMIERAALRKVAAMFLPAAAFVAAIPLIGLHVASGVYVFGMIVAQRRMAMWKALAIAIVTPLALYGTFDRGFAVSLPTGMLGSALGF